MQLLEVKEIISIKDKNFMCFFNYGFSNLPFKFFEEPLDISFDDNGGLNGNARYVILICSQVALRIGNEKAIKCFKIN